jgi:protein-S-isoprenylcysteine O-methyltransferase Ste14
MKKYLDWASRDYTMGQRMTALVPLAFLFLFFLPFLLVRGSGRLDRKLLLPRFRAGRVNRIAGASLGVAGVSFALWSIGSQMTVGSGTPLPMMPTQRLVVKPPFTSCRNPMTLGTILGGLGIGVWIGSFSAIAIVAALATALLTYVRFIEENELEARFGQDYVAYKRATPFLLPRTRRRAEEHRP